MQRTFLTGLVALSLGLASASASSDQFVHVEVIELDGDTRVAVNLPLDVATNGIAMIPRDLRRHGSLTFGGIHLHRDDLESLLVAAGPLADGSSTTLVLDGHRVDVSKSGEQLRLSFLARWWHQEDMEVLVSEPLVEALLGADSRDLDFEGALRALADQPELILTVEEPGRRTSARIWVDESTQID